MTASLSTEITLAEVSALVGPSPSHACTAFRQSTGQPLHAGRVQARMEKAKALLADPELSLTEIARSVGYAGQSAFGSAFRRVTATAPSAWRREASA